MIRRSDLGTLGGALQLCLNILGGHLERVDHVQLNQMKGAGLQLPKARQVRRRVLVVRVFAAVEHTVVHPPQQRYKLVIEHRERGRPKLLGQPLQLREIRQAAADTLGIVDQICLILDPSMGTAQTGLEKEKINKVILT